MTAEKQLERSVLEGKERDELHALAQALAVKTTTRTKKADIIDKILEATGVLTPQREANGSAGDELSTTTSKKTTSSSSSRGSATSTRRPRSRSGSESSTGSDDQSDKELTQENAGSDFADFSATSVNGTVHSSDSTSSKHGQESSVNGQRPNDELQVLEDDSDDSTQGSSVRNQGGSGRNNAQSGQNQNQNQNRQNQNQNQNQNRQSQSGDGGNKRGRRRRGSGRDRSPGGELQGGGNPDVPYSGELLDVEGLLDLRDEGYGFLRCGGYLSSKQDVYVSISQARRFSMRKGDYVKGACRPASNNEKYPALLRIDSISGLDPEEARGRCRFEDLTPLFPDSKLILEQPGAKDNVTARIVDLLAPVGKGQRGLIVSPPKAGKTTVMKQIAHSIEANNPEVHLIVLLVDERPEEVTDMRRSVHGEVVASTFDRPADEHTQVAELALERAKRLVELGTDVVIILDGITRLARAYNLSAPATGRIMSGGVDSGALYPPKKFFGAARNIEEGGSLTILATALVETGSKMDEVIFEEFKGTGNMELRLDRRLAERRLYPSIDVNASSTRHEELLFDRGQLQQVWKLRRVLNALASEGKDAAGLELLMDKIRNTSSNDEFLAEIAKGPTPSN